MLKSTRLLGLVCLIAATATLAACHRGQDVSFDGFSVSLHASNAPTATITSRGSFSVGSKDINITPDQRRLLRSYYNEVTAAHTDSAALKQAGWDMAGQALHVTGQSVEHAIGVAGASSTGAQAAGQAMQTKSQQMQERAQKLCHEVKQAQALQAKLGQQVPAFKPYAGINPAPGVQCGSDITVG